MTTILVRGGHFVGESQKKGATPQQKRSPLPIDTYEDEYHLEQALADEVRSEEGRQAKFDSLKAYIKFWALKRRQELDLHRDLACWSPCPQCSNCLCREPIIGGWAKCRCPEGKKQLSRYRIVFKNSAYKRAWETTIWEVGVGVVPRDKTFSKTSLVGARGID